MTSNAILILSIVGAVMAILAYGCVGSDMPVKFLNRIHWSIIAFVGYVAIMFANAYNVGWLVHTLGAATGLVTAYLMYRYFKHKLTCVMCPAIWGVNVVLVLLTVIPRP